MKLDMPSALVFDLDGTLVDSVADLTLACNLTRAELDYPPLTEDVVRGYIGDGARMLILRTFDGREDMVDDALARFRANYREHLLDNTVAYPGVRETLAAISDRYALPMGLVTNKPHDMAAAILEGLELAPYLTAVAGARRGVPVKPAPDMLDGVLAELAVDAAQAWMVGDGLNDVGVARATGAGAVAVAYGIGRRAALLAEGPDAMLERFPDLLELLEQMAA